MGTKIHGKQTRIIVDGFDWSCMLNSANISLDRDLVEASTFSLPTTPDTPADHKDYVPGLVGSRVSTRGIQILDTNPSTDLRFQKPWDLYQAGTLGKLSIFSSNAIGANAFGFEARISSQPREFPVSGVPSLASDWLADSVVYGKATSGGTAITATGALVGTQLEGPNADDEILTGRYVVSFWHLVKVAGTGTFAAKVQHSADSTNGTDGTWADVADHVSGTLSAVGVVRVATAAALDLGPWFRLNVTTFSGFTSVICRASTGTLLI